MGAFETGTLSNDYTASENLFMNGKAAMRILYNNEIGVFNGDQSSVKGKFGIFPFPVVDAQKACMDFHVSQISPAELKNERVTNMEKVYRNKGYITLFIAPGLILFLAVLFLPIIQAVAMSLYRWDGLSAPVFNGLTNYKLMFADAVFWKAILNNVMILGVSLVINLTLPLFFAYVLARGVKGAHFFRVVFFIPVVISAAVTGLLFKS